MSIIRQGLTITNEDTQPIDIYTSTTVDPSCATTYTNLRPSPFTSNEIYILPPPLTSLYSTLSCPPPPQPPTVPMVTDDNQLQEPGGGLNSGVVIEIASSLIILLIVISVTVFVSLTCNTIEVYLNDNNVYNIICHPGHHSTMKL